MMINSLLIVVLTLVLCAQHFVHAANCGEGTYSGDATGTDANGSCINCPSNSSTSSAGSTSQNACTCSAGYYGDATTGTCSACSAGKYKTASGNGAENSVCTACTANSSTASTGSTAQSACTCSPGYYGNAHETSGTCTACSAGKYKSELENLSLIHI